MTERKNKKLIGLENKTFCEKRMGPEKPLYRKPIGKFFNTKKKSKVRPEMIYSTHVSVPI